MASPPPFHPGALGRDDSFDQTLRPKSFDRFVGQTRAVENLRLAMDAARARGEALEHLLLSGLPGLGKTTLAGIVASAMDAQMHETSGPALVRPGDLVGILGNLDRGDVLFIDEIHRLNRPVEEKLYTAMEDFVVDIVLDEGPAARSLRINVAPFTLVGATTREGLLTAPLRARFGLQEKLELYPAQNLAQIVLRSAEALRVTIDEAAARLIASRSRGTPRVANRFLRRVRDLAQEQYDNRIDEDIAAEGLSRIGIDDHGLSRLDRQILQTILHHGGGPVGLKTIAVAVGEEERTIEDVYEPFLIRSGLLQRTPQGRCVSPTAAERFGAPQPGRLF